MGYAAGPPSNNSADFNSLTKLDTHDVFDVCDDHEFVLAHLQERFAYVIRKTIQHKLKRSAKRLAVRASSLLMCVACTASAVNLNFELTITFISLVGAFLGFFKLIEPSSEPSTNPLPQLSDLDSSRVPPCAKCGNHSGYVLDPTGVIYCIQCLDRPSLQVRHDVEFPSI